jgi:cell division protease FtsH
MVCDWGMSSLGLIAYGENQDHVFLGKEIGRNQNYSEETAKRIDREIFELIDGQYKRAIQILTEHMGAMHKLAEGLLEYETLEGKHVHEILEKGEIISSVSPTKREDKMEKPEESDESKDKENVKPVKKKDGMELGPDSAGVPAS